MSWPNFWKRKTWISYLLWPLSKCIQIEAARRYRRLKALSVPSQPKVIVVGNLVVGGSGKTPFITSLYRFLVAQGYKVGLIARGYGGHAKSWPQLVTKDSDPYMVGDEPVMLVEQLGCSMAVGPKRYDAMEELLLQHELDIVISDDGLQHHHLARHCEIVLIDTTRYFGNEFCLPAGPLREGLSRLKDVDFLVLNGNTSTTSSHLVDGYVDKTFHMGLQPIEFINIFDSSRVLGLTHFLEQDVDALAGIGAPNRFFSSLRPFVQSMSEHSYADHYDFKAADLEKFEKGKPLIMTHKDAVKCAQFANEQSNWWYLSVNSEVDERLFQRLLTLLKEN
jgi:tetraacyldisaccharide 4'-kinase